METYNGDARIPVDANIYSLRGKVVADVESLQRQASPGGGSIYGSRYYVSGSFFGPEMTGKGYVRLLLTESNYPRTPAGEVAVLKTEDTKAVALLPGDTVTFWCRAQYEALHPVLIQETFDQSTKGVWELDYCRLATPSLGKPEEVTP